MNKQTTRMHSMVLGLLLAFSITAMAPAQQISLVSTNFNGTGSRNDWSFLFVGGHRKSFQGRYVGFVSFATNLVLGGPSSVSSQLYVRDLESGTTQLITKNYQTGLASNGNTLTYEFSKDGRYLAFLSTASDLIPGTLNYDRRLYLRDMQTGVLKVVDVSSPGQPVNGQFMRFSLSNDGKKLAFASLGWNAGQAYDRNHLEDVYVYDADTGLTTLASVDRSGIRAGNRPSNLVQLSGDGRYVLFASSAANLVSEPVSMDVRNFYVRDLVAGTTKLASVTLTGTGGNVADVSDYYYADHRNWISEDGRYVTFFGIGDNYVTNDNNQSADLFQRDLVAGTTALVSVNTNGVAGGAGYSSSQADYAVTPDGRYVVFTGSNLTAGNLELRNNCFVRDMLAGTTRSVSGTLPRAAALSIVSGVDISPNGRYVFFGLIERPDGSTAIDAHAFLSDLVSGQLRDLAAPQGTYLGDVGGGGFSPDSDLLVLGAQGRLLPIDTNNTGDVYVLRLGMPTKNRRVGMMSLGGLEQ